MNEHHAEHHDPHNPQYAEYAETSAVERLKELGIEGLEYAFSIDAESDLEGNEIPAEIFWVRFKKPEDAAAADCSSIEGKLYIPKGTSNKELILFTPGFPGGNAGRFEQRYANAFVGAGYNFFTIRHNGTSVSKLDTAPEIINSPKRLALAQQHGEEHIGGTKEEGYDPAGILKEPIPALLALQGNSEAIHLMGQSMGAAASYHALTRMAEQYPDVAKKIQHVVSIAGYVGGEEGTEGELWDGLKMPMKDLAEYEMGYMAKVGVNSVKTPEALRASMKQAATMNEHMNVPDHVGSVLVFSANDPLVAGPDPEKENSVLNYGPKVRRKLLIRDESTLNDSKQHSMLWIKPENLIRAVQSNVSGYGPHYIKVPNQGEGMVEKG